MNDLCFSDSEIESVCEELGIPRAALNEKGSQRRAIIDCWDNANVIACPGSGKTTVLLAKLLLLSRRMPFADGRGICVLTHTNVAIDEIKSKLGSKADILFKHPNFFGTIQGFVNKFLAAPALNLYPDITQKRISKIDSDYAYSQKKNEYFKIEFGNNGAKTLRNYLYGQANIGKFKTTTPKERTENTNNLLKSLEFDLVDNIVKRGSGKTFLKNQDNDNYKAIKKLIFTVWEMGCFSYEDAYNFANWYITQHHSRLNPLFEKRFCYLFVDEMQDTQKNQMDIITSVFNDSVIKQYFGDPDQSIFNGISGGDMAWNYNQPNTLKLEISDSKRYSQAISQCINPFKTELSDVAGAASWNSYKPCILLYENPEEALEMFHEEIEKKGLTKDDSYINWKRESSPFNAVGLVGKESEVINEKLVIHSYTDNFSKETTNKKINFNNLVSYFQKRPIEETQQEGTRVYYSLFINAFIELLKLYDIHETRMSLFKDLSIEDQLFISDFKRLIFLWVKDIEADKKTPVDIKNEFLEFFKEKDLDFSGYTFAQDNAVLSQNEFKSNSNFFSKGDIDIKIGTIHSVKGETHMATLLFENQNYSESEADYFFGKASGNLFCGDKYERQKKSFKRIEERLKTAYVAMSRPTHLLCVAMSKERVGCMKCPIEIKEKCNWEVITN